MTWLISDAERRQILPGSFGIAIEANLAYGETTWQMMSTRERPCATAPRTPRWSFHTPRWPCRSTWPYDPGRGERDGPQQRIRGNGR